MPFFLSDMKDHSLLFVASSTNKVVFDVRQTSAKLVMSVPKVVCIICQEGATFNKGLTKNPEMITQLYKCCKERLSLGQSEIKQLAIV